MYNWVDSKRDYEVKKLTSSYRVSFSKLGVVSVCYTCKMFVFCVPSLQPFSSTTMPSLRRALFILMLAETQLLISQGMMCWFIILVLPVIPIIPVICVPLTCR